jgi:hypothetical protein
MGCTGRVWAAATASRANLRPRKVSTGSGVGPGALTQLARTSVPSGALSGKGRVGNVQASQRSNGRSGSRTSEALPMPANLPACPPTPPHPPTHPPPPFSLYLFPSPLSLICRQYRGARMRGPCDASGVVGLVDGEVGHAHPRVPNRLHLTRTGWSRPFKRQDTSPMASACLGLVRLLRPPP